MLLFLSDGFAATRKTVEHGQSKQSVLGGNGGSFQTPHGESAYYGQEFVDYHSAGNRFNAGDSPGTSPRQKITLKPQLKVNPRSAASAFMRNLRGGAAGVVATAAATAVVEAIGGFIDDNQIKTKHDVEVEPTSPGEFHWSVPYPDPELEYSSAVVACKANDAFYEAQEAGKYAEFEHEMVPSGSSFVCRTYGLNVNPMTGQLQRYGSWFNHATRVGSNCPDGATYNPNTGQCLRFEFGEPTEADWISMEDFAAVQDSDFVRDLVRDNCQNSPSPGRCYDELSEWGDLVGPSTQTSTPTVSTRTVTNPDGTTSTSTSSQTNTYTYNFGPNYYNYSTTTKTITNTDGAVTETTTSDSVPGSEPTEDPENDYTFSDSEFPEVPSFYEQKYPDGLGGVWNDARAQVEQSAFMQFLQGFIPSFSGSCPTFGLGFNIASWANYGNVQFSSICYVLDFVKVILLVTAIFTFRKVTFGG